MVDTTVKALYGRQREAVAGYNPSKPGRPSHTYPRYIRKFWLSGSSIAIAATPRTMSIELENRSDWGGFTTHDLNRCRIMPGIIALAANRWSLFGRLSGPDHQGEAITSRPLQFDAIGRQFNRGGRTTLTIISTRACASARGVHPDRRPLRRTARNWGAVE